MARSLPDRKAQEWQQRLYRFEKSRHTINEFCRQEGFSPQSFYLWRKRLGQLRVAKQPAAQPPNTFRPVRLWHSPKGERIACNNRLWIWDSGQTNSEAVISEFKVPRHRQVLDRLGSPGI